MDVQMTTIFVDGDACPVKAEIVRVADRYRLPVCLVSNQGLRHNPGAHVRHVMVGPAFDAADNWIVDHIASADVVITSDIQLAARCLGKGARALGPTGKVFSADTIGTALALRELGAYLREAGEIKGHNPPFSQNDRSRFLQALDRIIQAMKSSGQIPQ